MEIELILLSIIMIVTILLIISQTRVFISDILSLEKDNIDIVDIDDELSLKEELKKYYSTSVVLEMATELSENLEIKPNNYEYEDGFINDLRDVLAIKIFHSYVELVGVDMAELIHMVDVFKEFSEEILKNSSIIKDLQYKDKEIEDEVIIEDNIQKPNEIEQAIYNFYNDEE